MPTYLALKAGCKIHPVQNGPNLHEYVVETSDKRLYRLSALSRDVIERLENGSSLEEICGVLSQKYAGATAEEIRSCIVDMYRPILSIQDNGHTVEESNPNLSLWKQTALFFQITVVPERFVIAAARYLTFLYKRVAVLLLLACGIAAHVLCYSRTTNYGHTLAASTSITLVLCLLSVVFHELGHSSALRNAGGSPEGIGIGMFLLMPVFFANVSQIWILPKKSRMVVDLGGIYFQQIAFIIFAIAAALTHSPSFHAACIAIDVMCLIAINPAFRFDGYWLLADWIAIPKLHANAQTFLKNCLKRLFLRGNAEPLVPETLRSAKAFAFIAYAFLGNGFLAAVVLINLRSVRASVIRASQNIPRLFHQLAFAGQTGDWFTAVNSAISLWLVCAFVAAVTIMCGVYIYRAGRALMKFYAPSSASEAFSKQVI
jgi:putative peptide zinc metalloprotease protein